MLLRLGPELRPPLLVPYFLHVCAVRLLRAAELLRLCCDASGNAMRPPMAPGAQARVAEPEVLLRRGLR